ncbi:protein JBTS17 [Seriola dumerili]|uniref:protein JBTS17 n=1 Tax=Seriola dumerili TaxID=41447 RepID=UPI000BBEE107|nr:protein JBTS17 [Seriola dumerili]
MELKLEVVLSSSIKRKKPWPRFCWLGQEKESVFLLDDKRISEINMVSGRTKKRTPKLHPLLNSVVTMASSHNGIWLCGLLVSGELFLWNRDKDLLKTAAAALETVHIITSGSATRLSLQVSGDGMRVLLVAITGQVFLWECLDVRDLTGVRDGTVKGQWSHIQPLEDTILPSSQDKEASQHTIFVKTEVLGDACLSAIVFTSGKNLIITCLKVQWEEGHMRVGCMGYSVQWATKTYPMSCLTPPCQPVKSRGALVPAFSPDGKLLAVVLNQRQPKATQVLFVSTQNFVSISSSLGGCGSKKMEIPSKYIRSYWVGSVSWSPSGLFLACVLKRGSLLMLARLGGLLTLTSSGCNIDLGPAQFLPLHPLVTYRPPLSAGRGEASLSSSSLSVRDVLRQRYSVTWHPRLLYLIVSDGYMATVMRVLDRPSPAVLLKTLLKDTSKDLEKASRILDKSQIHVRAWLESVSCLNLDSSLEVLNATVTCGPNTSDSVFSAATDRSTLPIFLQDKGTLAGTKELLEKVQTFFEDDSDLDGPPAGSHVEDGGRLEFASMFDTLHAQDTQNDTEFVTGPDYEKDFVETERKTPLLHHELGKIQKKESPSQPPQLWPSDVHYVPLLQEEKEKTLSSLNQAQPVPQRPSSRLFGVWQWVYQVTQQYLEELNSFKGCDGWEEEQQQLSFIMSQIQTALQATGERLEEGPALLSYPGCDRSVFQEARICLALLYSLLSQYRLREAQELGDHMAHLILHRAGHQRDNMACITDSLPCPWLPMDLHSDTACAVVQSLGRFMASYFTNQPLHILPPHNVAVLPPLHLPHAPNVGRLVPLGQEEVATAVRRQQLSEVWTVEYAQDLLLLGGLLPEAVWLAYHLGDWKTAVSLSLAYSSYCTDHLDFAGLRRKELHLPTVLEAESIFQAELECLLGHKSDSQDHTDSEDPLEGEDWDLLQVSIQEILKASVVAGVNVMSSPLSSLLDKAKDLCSCLPMLVPNGLYLPSPPLYCPQPSPNTQDPIGTMGQFAEVASRHKVSGVLQRLLLLLRSARCCHPAAQWYITHLRRARHLLHKIKKKYSYPAAAEEERAFPEGLMKFVTRSGFFKRGPNKDGHLDSDTIQTIICFRELCGLCWMLHVRDRLSISCRKYQAARQHGRDEQIPVDSEVRASCIDALHWACRFLPFSRFLNAEEILQDILLSLVSELPPVSLVADTLVRAFPEEEESVRVPLREKYNSVLQRLRQCNVLEEEKEEVNELMMILIQDKHRQRRKHLGRLRRHLGPPELHLWEKEEEEDDRGGKHGMAILRQLSLGTSLSTSTLTDCGFPSVCSDGDTTENTSEAISPEQHCQPMTRDKKAKRVRDREYAKKTAVKIESAIQEETQPDDDKGNEKFSLPVVGTWEFELEDEEYLNFLELFLSYVLEKDSADGGDSGSELPLLKGFSSQLRERELHSLTFDVLTTIHRRQRDGHHPGRKHWSNDPPVFRAGCCYKPIKQGATPEPQTSSIWSEAPISRASLSVSSLPGLRTGRQKGLFGLRQQSSVPLTQRMKGGHSGSETSPFQSAFPMGQPSESFIFGSSTSVEAVTELQQGLDPKLEAQFPELGRLLEWMVRWADRRMLLGHHGKKKKERGGGVGGTADEGVVIRVKASAPAVLTALSLLEWRYTALLTSDHYSAHIQVPETQWTVVPVLQPEVDRKLERESSVDTGYPGSANTPITGLDHNVQQGELSISLQAPPHPEPQALLIVQPEASVHTEHSDSTGVQLPNTPIDPPSLQPQSSTAGAPTAFSTAPSQPTSSQTPPMRQRLGEDLFRLVQLQNINYMSLMEVLGASFSNLQLAQQSSSLAQSNMNSSHPNVPSSHEMQPLLVQAESPEIQFIQSKRLIPSSQGLLATTHILPLATPSNQMTRLMSMEELTSSVIRRQNAEEAQLRLLRVDPPTENTRAATTSPSSKRQRRREVKERRERKTEVTFRPNESIIPVREPTDGPINEEPTVAEEITPGHDFAIPLGSFDSLLTGQRLLDKAMSTSAELHAFASTCKRPPECHDAFTNTDPTSTPTRVDKAVSASVTTSSPKSQSSQNFQVCTEHPVQDTGETPKKAEKILDLHGHQFISVLDLEDEALHHDLPLCLSPETQDIPPIRPSSPTSADLHVLATSVIWSASAAADPQPSILITDNLLKPTNHPEIPEDTPLLSHIEPSTYPERITPQDMADPSDSEICQAIRTQSVGPHRASSSPPAVWFSSRLSEMDAQLAALQNIADHLEMDFSNSRMLVNTIETLTPVLAPDVKSTMAVKKTVRLSVPREAWTPRSDILMEPKACEEEEENQQDKYVHRDSRTPERKPTFRYLTSPHSHTAGLSYLHTPPNQLSEASGISHVWEDENLGHTGLSDTAEILDELVKEGYLSPTDLDLSTSHTAHYSRSVLPEDERRELRIWMRRKQRERLAVYQKHRESLREREHKPFTASAKVKSTNRNQATIWETREEKEKFMLLEQYNQRTREACSLASDFATSTQILRSSSQPEGPPLPSITRSTSTPPCGSRYHLPQPYSAPANDKRSLKSQSGQTQPRLRPWTAEVQARPSEDHSRRLGLHRPVTSLPRDRLSQVTRRGMLSDTKSHTKLFTESQSEERHVEYQRKTHLSKSPSGGTAVGRGIQREGTKMEDREEVNLWEPTSKVNRLLDLEESESNIVLARLLDEQDGGARAGVSGMDWLDNLSESASSSLSKIDWAAIERMVAGEEA